MAAHMNDALPTSTHTQAQPGPLTVHASQIAQSPRSPKLQQSRQQQQRSECEPNARELNGQLREADSAREMLTLVQSHHQQFNKIHVVTVLQTLAKMGPKMRSGFASHAAWPLLQAAVQRSVPFFDARQLSGSVSACGTLGVKPAWLPQLLATASASMQTKPRAWNLRYLATLLTGLAKLQYKGDDSVWAPAAAWL